MSSSKNKTFWFYIEPFVHIALKKNHLLLYNTLNGKAIEQTAFSPSGGNGQVASAAYKSSGNSVLENADRNAGFSSKIFNICKKLLSKKNLRVIRLTETELLKNLLLAKFIKKVINYHMGDLLEVSLSAGKPMQLAPMLSIQRDVERLRKDPGHSVGEYVLNYLDEISFYINDGYELDMPIFYSGWQQFLCGIKSRGRNRELELEKIGTLLDEAAGSPLSRINILGGNIFNYSKFPALLALLGSHKAVKTFHLHYTQLENREKELYDMAAQDSAKLRVLIDFPLQEKQLAGAFQSVEEKNLDTVFEFIVASEADFRKAQELIAALKIAGYSFQPFYNGRNLGFFKKYVFLKKQAVLASKPTIEEVLSRSVVNAVNFGRLTALPNGSVYANVNAGKLGRLGKDSLPK